HHEQIIEIQSGLLERWQITADRGEANRVVIGGPREAADRIFGSTEAAGEAPKSQTVAKSERAQIESNIAALGKTRDQAKKAARTARATANKTARTARDKALAKARTAYDAAIKKAEDAYKAAMRKAKTDSEKNSAKYTRESAISSAKSTLKYAEEA